MPLPIAVFLLVSGLLLFLVLRRPRWGGALVLSSPLVILAASWAPVADALLQPLETRYPALLDVDDAGPITAVVVLGAGYRDDSARPVTSNLGARGMMRLSEGIRLHRQLDSDSPLVVSGGGRAGDVTTAGGYRRVAEALGVDPDAIIEHDEPRDTAQEAQAVRSRFGADARVLLVTSASHMPRAMRHFEHVGLDPVAAPTGHHTGGMRRARDWVPGARHLRRTERALHEYMGLIAVGLDHR